MRRKFSFHSVMRRPARRDRQMQHGGLKAVIGLLILLLPQAGHAEDDEDTSGPGRPVPRFVSLKSNAVNVRGGPTRESPIVWSYKKAGLPVEVIQEFEDWRKIRDWEGAEGWVYRNLLSPRRTGMIMPWAKTRDPVEIRAKPSDNARIAAYVEPLVTASLDSCDGKWCHLESRDFSGWVEQSRLWGVLPMEKTK